MSFKGLKHSEQTKRKLSELNKGKILSAETKLKISLATKGKLKSEETRRKISEARMGSKNPMYGKEVSQERKKHYRKLFIGRKISEEQKKAISEKQKGRQNFWCVGEKKFNWKGGITKLKNYRYLFKVKDRARRRKAIIEKITLKDWIRIKLNYKNSCSSCGRREPDIKLTVDHIIPIIKGGKHSLDNIQPLCRSCNSKKHVNIVAFEPSGQMKIMMEAR